ncbi:hypothetical protein N2152v2_002876 [Parachlorella kessleri]
MVYNSSDNEDFSSEEEQSEDEELALELAAQKEQEAKDAKREAIYNADVMHDKLEDIAWTEEQPWEETLAVTSSNPVHIENVDDDLERELAFYNQASLLGLTTVGTALEAAKLAIGRFEEAGIAWQRPPDYYAEMVKTDEHMAKVKEQLLYEQRQIEAMEQRKKDREAKKFSKQVAAERKKERAQDKKKAITDVAKLRKQREKSGFAGDLDVDKELERMEGRGRKRDAPSGNRFEAREQSKKRQQRDSKFGFGGPKRLRKQNDASSAADVDGYRPSRFDDGVGAKVAGRGALCPADAAADVAAVAGAAAEAGAAAGAAAAGGPPAAGAASPTGRASRPDKQAGGGASAKYQLRNDRRQPSRHSLLAEASAHTSASSPPDESGVSSQWSSAVCSKADVSLEDALAECVREALSDGAWPADSAPQVAFIFISSSYQSHYERVLPLLREKVPSLQHAVGCSGFGVLGMHRGAPEEWEQHPALSITLASLPGVLLKTFHVSPITLPDADAPPSAWYKRTGMEPVEGTETNFILLGDAAFGGVMDLLAGLDYAYPTARKAGGLNSSASMNSPRALWAWSAADDPQGTSNGFKPAGLVGLALQGPLVMDTLVAQGCRPLGDQVYSVSKAHRSLVLEVVPEGSGAGGSGAGGSGSGRGRGRQGVAPLEVVKRELSALPEAERESAARNLMVGLVPDDFKPVGDLSPGDFLVRQLMGMDANSGALMIGDVVRVGQRLRFVVRDRQGAMHDLVSHGVDLKKRELTASLAGDPLPPPLGCLIFTCNGRGRGLYRVPHFDSRTLAEYAPVPSSGFFCNGEIGQVGAATYLHGFTCSAAVFRAAGRQGKPQQPQEQQQQQRLQPGEQEGEPQQAPRRSQEEG